MIKKYTGYIVLSLYFLVLAVATTEGPLISYQSLLLGVIGLITFILIASELATSINLVDIPDNIRRRHTGSIPLIGGIALFISFIYGAFVFGVSEFYIVILLSLLPIIIVGTIDGIKDINVPITFRLIAQIVASWIVILSTDIYLKDLGNLFGTGIIYLDQFGIPFTIFAVVGVCNAFNMLDGKDGLVGSVSVIIIFSLFVILFFQGITFQWGRVLILSLLVYLAFNLNLFGKKRKIFLGDHGSNGLGHIIAWNLIYLSQETDYITPVSALWFALLPLTDAFLTIIRRIRSSNSVLMGDRQHFHHLLVDKDFSDRQILLIFVIITIFSNIFAVVSNIFSFEEYYLFYTFLTLIIMLLILGLSKPKGN